MLLVTALSAPCAARATSGGVGLSGTLGTGWDSDHSLLGSARPVPPPKNRAAGVDDTGLVALLATAQGWISPVDVVRFQLDQSFEYLQFFDAANLVVPRTDLWLGLTPGKIFSVRMGASYRYYRHSLFLDDVFHEPGGWVVLSLRPGNHEISLLYEVAHRLITGSKDDTETEQVITLGWSMKLLHRVLTVGLRASGIHIRGTEDWMQLDGVRGQVFVSLDHGKLDGGISWTPAGVWFEEGIGFFNVWSGWFGVAWLDWLRMGIEYDYERLDEKKELPPDAPYQRHVLLATLTFSWEWTSDPGYIDQGSHVLAGQEGIAVKGRKVTFVVAAPQASSVALAGSFDDWQTETSLQGPDDSGLWRTTMELPPGRHEITYVIDGEPVVPPGAALYADDGFGGTNAVIVIEK